MAIALPRSIEMVVGSLGHPQSRGGVSAAGPGLSSGAVGLHAPGRPAGLCLDQRPDRPAAARECRSARCLITRTRSAHWLRARRLTPRMPSAPGRSAPTTPPTSSTPPARPARPKACVSASSGRSNQPYCMRRSYHLFAERPKHRSAAICFLELSMLLSSGTLGALISRQVLLLMS